MVGYRILSKDECTSLKKSKYRRFKSIMDFTSIFTYSEKPDQFVRDENQTGLNNNMMKYVSVPQEDVESSRLETAFDYESIFSYSTGSNKVVGKIKSQQWETDPDKESNDDEKLTVDSIISNTALILSYILVFFTLPISIWFCFKHLPQWERIVVYRLGKLHGVLGPGNIFVIPWLDQRTKLDLRTQLISHPTKQVIATILIIFNSFLWSKRCFF